MDGAPPARFCWRATRGSNQPGRFRDRPGSVEEPAESTGRIHARSNKMMVKSNERLGLTHGGEVRAPVLNQRGAAGWALLWLLGIPIPVLLVFFLLRGCT
jgi:hypothetical protein